MKIALCVKQVPDTTDIKWTENNTIRRDGLESVINPYDVYSVENALRLKNKYDNVEATAISMGPMQAETMLRKILGIGIDNAILLCDKKFAGSDTYATAKTVSAAIRKFIPDFDVIICGQFATDGDTAQTGPSIANFLDIPQVTFVKEILEYKENKLTVMRETTEGFETVRVSLPALICVLKNEWEPSRALINGIKEASKKDILIKTAEDIDIPPEYTGIKGSPTYVSKAFRANKRNSECKIIEDVNTFVQTIKSCGGINNE